MGLHVGPQGSKRERLESLMDADAEVYASVFSPDPIEYRAERGLLDFREEMGILIQEVVGTRVGSYFLLHSLELLLAITSFGGPHGSGGETDSSEWSQDSALGP